MSIKELKQIALDDFTLEDLDNLKVALELDPKGDPEEVRNLLLRGVAIPWRYTTKNGTILFILEEDEDKDGKFLFIWYMSGKGLHGNVKYIVDVLCEFARMRNCHSIQSLSIPTIAKYIERFGFKPQMVSMKKEI